MNKKRKKPALHPLAVATRWTLLIPALLGFFAITLFSQGCGVKAPPTPYIETEAGRPKPSPQPVVSTPTPAPSALASPAPKAAGKKLPKASDTKAPKTKAGSKKQ